MSKKIKYIFLVSIAILLGFCTKSQARITTTDPSVTSGEKDTVTITINSQEPVASGSISVSSTGGLEFVKVTGGTQKGSTVAFAQAENKTSGLATYTFKVPTVTSTTTYKVTFTSKDMADENGEKVGGSTATSTVTVKAKEEPKPTTPPTTTNNNGGTTSKPKEPTFTKVNETVYVTKKVNVRQSYSTSSKSLGTLEVGESLTRTGKGSNGWSRVQYNGKEAYINASYLSTKKPEEETPTEKSNNKALKSLTVTSGELTPAFDPETTKYDMQVEQDITEVTVEALAEDEKATVEVTGDKELKLGENTVTIKVTAEDETVRTYTITVLRGESAEEPQLTALTIKNGTLNPRFQADVYSYELVLTEDLEKLDLELMTANDDTKYEVVGNENLQNGSIVKIIVYTGEKDADGSNQTEYQIKIKKNLTATTGTTTNTLGGMNQTTIIVVATIILVTAGIIALFVARYFTTKGEKKETEEGDFGVFDGLSGAKNKRDKEDEDFDYMKRSLSKEEDLNPKDDDNDNYGADKKKPKGKRFM